MPSPPVCVAADADPAVRALLVTVLSRAGFDVRPLAGPWELGTAPLDGVALMVLGGRGHGVSPADAARDLRAAGNPTPVVILVNLPDPGATSLAAADPTVRLVAKPFLPADLTAAVAGLLGRG
ncbi:MAG TPA: hypothetical protein VD866_14995 [Urbifossiella sp.]|nr:hypothetical protein [Urbifossiella sp.]